MLQTLKAQWEWYLKKIKEGEEMLDNTKDQFKLTLLNEADALKKDSKKLLDDFDGKAPFTSNWYTLNNIPYHTIMFVGQTILLYIFLIFRLYNYLNP